jgi:hypothetical protein
VKDAAEGLNAKAGASAFNFATTVAAAATLLVGGAELVCTSPPPPSSTSSHESGSAITRAQNHGSSTLKKQTEKSPLHRIPPKKIREKD